MISHNKATNELIKELRILADRLEKGEAILSRLSRELDTEHRLQSITIEWFDLKEEPNA